MAYITKGDLLEVNGRQYLAVSDDYIKSFGGLSLEFENDWEVANVVDIVNPQTGSKSTIRTKYVQKLS